MDFARLPDIIFLKIIEYLPPGNRVRVGRVNKSFRRISQLATSLTTSLDLTQDCFKNLDADQLAVLLDLCARNLEMIKFPNIDLPLLMTFAEYECPRLIYICINEIPIGKRTFGELMKHEDCRYEELTTKFPDLVNSNLISLFLETGSDGALASLLIGHCPNLKQLYLIRKNATADVLNRFFASVPQLKEVYFRTNGTNIAFESLVNMWKLPLTELVFADDSIPNSDSVLQKVAASFPHLQTLKMNAKDASDIGIASLGALQDLKELELYVKELSRCKNLELLVISKSVISGSTLVALFRGCSRLKYVFIASIHGVNTPEEAAVVLGNFSGMANRFITIAIFPYSIKESSERLESIWETEPVKEMIKMLEENEGLEIFLYIM